MTNHSHLVHSDTVSVGADLTLRAQQRQKNLGLFRMTYQYAINKIGDDIPEVLRTIHRLTAKIKYDNVVVFRKAALAREMKVNRATIERHVKLLIERGIIEPDAVEERDTIKGVRVWRICPFLGWQGEGKDLRDYLAALPSNHPFLQYMQPDKM